MNGVIKVSKEWINLNGAEVIDINGTKSAVVLIQAFLYPKKL